LSKNYLSKNDGSFSTYSSRNIDFEKVFDLLSNSRKSFFGKPGFVKFLFKKPKNKKLRNAKDKFIKSKYKSKFKQHTPKLIKKVKIIKTTTIFKKKKNLNLN